MEKRVYETLREELFYEKMDNGLDVYILPKRDSTKRTPCLRRITVRWTTSLSRSVKRR